ncbi:Na(+)/H(+) exchanger beta [Armadillidium vulgare]|nr:Na(+)/H(+) exchanger beta [Armadillidium vulgare]
MKITNGIQLLYCGRTRCALFIAVFLLSALANVYRTKSITFEEQFISAYGGLRGAVAFSLAITMDEKMKERNIYIFTTLIVILFTVFVQGITIKPSSSAFKNQEEKPGSKDMDHMMAGIEEILGHHGDFYSKGVVDALQ